MKENRQPGNMPEDETGTGTDGSEEAGADALAEAGDQVAVGTAGTAPVADVEGILAAERDKYLRLAAEFDNFRKRSAKERLESGWRSQADLVSGLLDILDDIMRFAHLEPDSVDSATVIEGVGMVERKLLKALGGHGLELVDPADQAFDPALHEAVGTEPAESPDQDDVVARVYQQGYVFRGQMLRPARVVVRQWVG